MSDLLNKLGASMLLSQDELMKLIRSAPRRYKVYQIPKRKPGEFRVIAQPAKEVKALQYWVMDAFLAQFAIHASATAYRGGKNIADNARPHRHGKFLLKLDFKDFFPSIKARDFRSFLQEKLVGLEEGDVEALSRILFWKPKGTQIMCLSIGAPSSPLLSNLLLYEFDQQVAAFCGKHDISYTRYADDLSFSSDESKKLESIERFITGLCNRSRAPKLTLNQDKTVRLSKATSRRVTGLILTNDEQVSLGRDLKRRIRSVVHYFVNGRLSREEILELKGMLAYVKSVEPTFLGRLRQRYGADTILRIQKSF